MPIAIESLCPFCSDGMKFLKELSRQMIVTTADICEIAYLFQQLSVAAQNFKCVLFRCSFGFTVNNDEDIVWLVFDCAHIFCLFGILWVKIIVIIIIKMIIIILLQRLFVSSQQYNAVCIRGTFGVVPDNGSDRAHQLF